MKKTSPRGSAPGESGSPPGAARTLPGRLRQPAQSRRQSPAAPSGRKAADSSAAPALRVLIVDDHAVMRRGLAEILMEEFLGTVVGEAVNGASALEQVDNAAWDLVLLDLCLPGRSGLDLLQDLKGVRPLLPVLVLSVYSEDQFAVRALRSGAAGYITKDSAAEELITAVRKVLSGGKYVSAALAEKLADDLASPAGRRRHEALSNREFEVMRLMASGLAAKEIAAKLSLSVKTISTYRARILAKMDFKTNADLTRYALHEGLTD